MCVWCWCVSGVFTCAPVTWLYFLLMLPFKGVVICFVLDFSCEPDLHLSVFSPNLSDALYCSPVSLQAKLRCETMQKQVTAWSLPLEKGEEGHPGHLL